MTGATLTIDLDALTHNLGVMRAAAGRAQVAAVVKADAYGLGAGPISIRLWADGVRRFYVARLSEGEALRAALDDRAAEIMVFDGLVGDPARFRGSNLAPVLCTRAQVAAAQATGFERVALQVDTGMNRQGLSIDEAKDLAGTKGLEVAWLLSHLGSATDPSEVRNAEQLARFRQARALFPRAKASLAASAGAFLGPDYAFDEVRAGITLYGGGPEERPDPSLSAVAVLTAPVLDIRTIGPQARLGYGRGFIAEAPMRIAVVGAGYADGFIRTAAGRAAVWCAGALRRVLTVNMDLLTLDIGDAEVAIGDVAQLVGPDAPLDDLALASNTVAHEVLTRISSRADRIYRAAVS